jgi:DNA-binding transcriptional LysR family regulator
VRSGEADLLVDWLPEVPGDLACVEIARTTGWLVAPASGPFAPKGRLTFQSVASTPFIAYGADRTLHELQRKALSLHGLSPREAFAADSSDTILGFVAAGLGFSLVPAMGETFPRVAGVVAERVTRPLVTFPVYAVWRRGPVMNPLVEAALEVAPGGPRTGSPSQHR